MDGSDFVCSHGYIHCDCQCDDLHEDGDNADLDEDDDDDDDDNHEDDDDADGYVDGCTDTGNHQCRMHAWTYISVCSYFSQIIC